MGFLQSKNLKSVACICIRPRLSQSFVEAVEGFSSKRLKSKFVGFFKFYYGEIAQIRSNLSVNIDFQLFPQILTWI